MFLRLPLSTVRLNPIEAVGKVLDWLAIEMCKILAYYLKWTSFQDVPYPAVSPGDRLKMVGLCVVFLLLMPFIFWAIWRDLSDEPLRSIFNPFPGREGRGTLGTQAISRSSERVNWRQEGF